MASYTPNTEEVRESFAGHDFDQAIAVAQFDRWLAEVERAAAERAWDAGKRSGGIAWPRQHNPYRAAALGLTAEQEGEKS